MRNGTNFLCWLTTCGMTCLLFSPQLLAQDNSNALRDEPNPVVEGEPSALTPKDDIDALILQLGNDDYTTRVLAEKKLIRLGGQAIEPLKKALVSDRVQIESEIRFRARRLVVLLERENLKVRRLEFLARPDHDLTELGFSGWRQFASICGANRRSRQMFLRMRQSHPEWFQSLESGTPIGNRTNRVNAALTLHATSAAQRVDSISAMMFFQSLNFDRSFNFDRSTESEFDWGWATPAEICGLLNRADTATYIRRVEQQTEIEALIEFWLNQPRTADLLSGKTSSTLARIELTQNFRLLGQTPFLFGLIENRTLPIQTRAKAVSTLGNVFSRANKSSEPNSRAGDEDFHSTGIHTGVTKSSPPTETIAQIKRQTLDRLKPFLSDSTSFGRFPTSGTNPQMLDIQFRDLVLAACVKISGYESDELANDYEYFLDSSLQKKRFAFADDISRVKAIETWLQWNELHGG